MQRPTLELQRSRSEDKDERVQRPTLELQRSRSEDKDERVQRPTLELQRSRSEDEEQAQQQREAETLHTPRQSASSNQQREQLQRDSRRYEEEDYETDSEYIDIPIEDKCEGITVEIFDGPSVILKLGDITKENAEAYVNAANMKLRHEGGIALAINNASNNVIQTLSNDIIKGSSTYINVGEIVTTPTKNSSIAKYVIHGVGPKKGERNIKMKLKTLLNNIFNEAVRLNVTSIAIPPISTGIFGVEKNIVAEVFCDFIFSFVYS